MKKLKFKTNINCMGCVAQFTPFIQNEPGVKSWNVDVNTPDKLLTVEGDLTEDNVKALVTEAGFVVREVVS